MTNAEQLAIGLKDFENQEEQIQDIVAGYIECPYIGGDVCHFDDKGNRDCTACKVEWLLKEWEG